MGNGNPDPDGEHPSIACTRCGCVCDDIVLSTRGGRIVAARNACHLAEDWFLAQNARFRPPAEIGGKPAKLEEAYAKAAEILKNAKAPLIYGLSRSTTDGQRKAVELAEACAAILDTTASLEHAQSLMALQQVGESTCTLGEVRNRADLVIYWGSNPIKTHPRHIERYTKPGRELIVVDVKPTETTAIADKFTQVEPGTDREAFQSLRLLVQGHPTGNEPKQWVELAERMKAAKFGVFFFGNGLTRRKMGHRTVEALLQLVTDLNHHTRFYARRMRVLGDVAGADSVLTWTTGYPFAVNLQRGFPRYNPGEWSAPDLLERREVDAVLMLGSETTKDFPAKALDWMRHIPLIAIDSADVEPPMPATVRFTTCVYGIHRPGTAYRMDEVPIPLRTILPSDYPSDAEVLEGIRVAGDTGTAVPELTIRDQVPASTA